MSGKKFHAVFIDQPAGHDELYKIIIDEMSKGTQKVEIFFPDNDVWRNHVGDMSSPLRPTIFESPSVDTEAFKLENLLRSQGYRLIVNYNPVARCVRYEPLAR